MRYLFFSVMVEVDGRLILALATTSVDIHHSCTSCLRDKFPSSSCARTRKREELSQRVVTTRHESTSYNVTVHESLSLLNIEYRAHQHTEITTVRGPDTRIKKSEKIGKSGVDPRTLPMLATALATRAAKGRSAGRYAAGCGCRGAHAAR